MRIISASETIFYTIERAIKEYRKFAQKKISSKVDDITIDQALVLSFLEKHPELSQKEIAALVFKDNASMTRMVNLMVTKEYLSRSISDTDRRRYKLEVTKKGIEVLDTLSSVVLRNREQALEGITREEMTQLNTILNKIISNCN